MKTIVFILLFLKAIFTQAAGNETFTIDLVGCLSSGICFAGISPSATLTSCASKTQIRFNISQVGSQAQYSALLTAFTTGKKVRIALSDTCIDNFSSPDWLHVNND